MKKIKIEWLAAALVIIIMGGVLAFILISNFNSNNHDADIQLPDLQDNNNTPDLFSPPDESGDGAYPISITRQNVLKVVATMQRPVSYYIRLETVVSYHDESRVTEVDQWMLPDGFAVKKQDSLLKNTFCVKEQNGTVYMWYEGDVRLTSVPANSVNPNTAAGIPTYEDVLALDSASISAANYMSVDGEPCIFIETYDSLVNYRQRFYISAVTGLLIKSETYSKNELVYSMNMTEYSEDVSGIENVIIPE